MDKISVLIVDDHGVVRQGLLTYLKLLKDIEVIGEAADAEARSCLGAEIIGAVAGTRG